jgi:hypothetical protein
MKLIKIMFNKILILLTVMLLIQSIDSLNSADLCISSVCNEEYSFKCTKNLCSFNRQTCNEYYRFKMNYISRPFHNSISFQSCESYKLRENDYCLRNNNCYYNVFSTMRKTSKKIMDCKCNGKYSFKCDEYCTLDHNYCDLLNLRIKYQKKTNKKGVKTCDSYSQNLIFF